MGIGIAKAISIRIFTWILRTQNYEPVTMLLNQCIIKYIALNILVHYDIGNRQNWNGFFSCLHGLTGSQNAVLSEYWLSWRRQQIETLSALLALCEGNSLVTGVFPPQRPVTRRFDVFFDLCLNKRLSKHSWRWWFGTLSRSLLRHFNAGFHRSDMQ